LVVSYWLIKYIKHFVQVSSGDDNPVKNYKTNFDSMIMPEFKEQIENDKN